MLNQQLHIDGGRHARAPATESQKLFDSAPQIRGQIALETDWCEQAACPSVECVECKRDSKLRKRTVFEPCDAHAAKFAEETRYRRAEVMVEGGWGSPRCSGDGCRMRPGTDFYTRDFVAAYPIYRIGDDQR